ncbi:MAG: hypothetical protein IJA83_04710 [Clostridia bacterium]|nr:hypothetical protein [Clostridia bacterium]
MQTRLRSALSHALLSFLFALGMALTALSVSGLPGNGGWAALLLAGLSAALAAAGLNRKAAMITGCACAAGAVVWVALGGWRICAEVTTALLLRLSGLPTALPLVQTPFTAILCVLCAGMSWFVTQRSAGAYPALILLALTAALLWLGNAPDAAPCLLPAVLACVTLLLRAGDEATSTWHVLPLSAAVTALAALCLLLGGLTSPPMKDFADTVRQRIYDTLFFTQPRDVFTLATEGYYPQGMSQLGGPATPREDPVMAVITPRKAYLRGVVKNVYTGRVWLDDIGGRRYLYSASQFDDIRSQTFDHGLPLLDAEMDSSLLTPQLLQVRMLRDSASTMFVPQRLKALSPEGDLIAYFNRSSEVFATANLQLGDVWTAEAALFTSMDRGVETLVLAADGPDPNWDAVCDTYLQLPEHLQAEVYDIAAKATYGADSDYAKAIALQSYLASHYTYNLDVPEQNPSHDFVSTFLLETKEGYCTYFASAMTVLCRMAGLPARYVEGYVAYPDETGLAYVTGREGHAWTEVYFRNFGWVTFDATPTSVEYTGVDPDDLPGDSTDEPEASPEPSEEPTTTPEPSEEPASTPEPTPDPVGAATSRPPDQEDAPSDGGDSPASAAFPWWMVWVVILAAAGRWVLTLPQVQVLYRKNEFARWMVWVTASHDALARLSLTRSKEESPAAFLRRAAKSGLVRTPLRELEAAENLMFYGHAAPYQEETAQARQVFRSLYSELKPTRKALFHLMRWAGRNAFTQ